MDLNYLYQRHQISLFMSTNAACESSRRTHLKFTDAYAALIATARRRRPAAGVQ